MMEYWKTFSEKIKLLLFCFVKFKKNGKILHNEYSGNCTVIKSNR